MLWTFICSQKLRYFYKGNVWPQKGINNSALTLWFVSIDSFWSLSPFQSKYHQSATGGGEQLDFSPSLLPFAWAAHWEAWLTFYPEAFVTERKWGHDGPAPTASSPGCKQVLQPQLAESCFRSKQETGHAYNKQRKRKNNDLCCFQAEIHEVPLAFRLWDDGMWTCLNDTKQSIIIILIKMRRMADQALLHHRHWLRGFEVWKSVQSLKENAYISTKFISLTTPAFSAAHFPTYRQMEGLISDLWPS